MPQSVQSTEWQGRWPNFREAEFVCHHCGTVHMDPHFMDALQQLRMSVNRPFAINSGYRCPQHPAERSKAEGNTGAHTLGRAADVACDGALGALILQHCFRVGMTGIGVSLEKGEAHYIHVDNIASGEHSKVRPLVWSY